MGLCIVVCNYSLLFKIFKGDFMTDAISMRRADRMAKINKIKETVVEANRQHKVVLRDKLIAVLCLQWGMSRRSIIEYLTQLKDADIIVIIDNQIYMKAWYDKYGAVAQANQTKLKRGV